MSRKKKISHPITALYCRISLEDGKENESMSISTQKSMLKEYAEQNGMNEYEFYVDDGYTGRNFKRPGFQKMLADIEAGRIDTVITKDLSRLGRNYIEAGTYIEVYFPQHNVRYIALNDNVDTARDNREMDITPFKNILNDMYSRDISRKVYTAWMARSRQGIFMGGQPPFGLMRDPDQKGHLIIDPEAAPTIRRIYDMALDGWGCKKIARALYEDKVPSTTLRRSGELSQKYKTWADARISFILRNPFYYGAHLVARTHQKGIRSGTIRNVPRDEWEIIEDCHEAIIPKDEWMRVQEIMDARPRIMVGKDCPYYNIFHGIIYCGTCGKSMQSRYEKVGRTDRNRFTGQKREPIDKAFYSCQTYNRIGKDACASHKIEARDLHNIVLADIRDLASQAIQDADAFYDRLANKLKGEQNDKGAELAKELAELEQRAKDIDAMIMDLYQDKFKKVISDYRYQVMSGQLEEEQLSVADRIREITQEQNAAAGSNRNILKFIDEIRDYAEIKELDEAILHRLIKKIIIGEKQVIDGQKVQDVTIIYNFVGQIA